MTSYAKLIRQDVHVHNPRGTSSWPPPISELVRSIQNCLKIPSWLKSGPAPYTNDRAIKLLDQLRASGEASNVDLWDDGDRTVDEETKERLHAVFNTALVDCTRIRAVVETENLTGTPHPKESFLVVLVRNAIFNAHPSLSVLEEVPVVFPRHPSGEAIPILKFMTKHFYAPLVASAPQEMPAEQTVADLVGESSDEEEDSRSESELFKNPGPTMSEFLDACERPMTPVEIEEEPEEPILPPQFDAHFLAFRPSATTPSTCHVPVLCMADEEQLPVLMSTLLYQRRVWRISDPLIGLEFSKYETTIRLFAGWLEDDTSADCVLPRVHIGVVGTPIELDLSTPSGALVVSRFICTLESHMVAVRDSVRDSVGAVVRDTQSRSSRSWRIDTDGGMENSVSDLESNRKRDVIMGWVKSQTSQGVEGEMAPRKKAGSATHGSATSAPSPQSTLPPTFFSLPPSSVTSTSTPEGQHAPTDDDIPTFYSRLSCSKFAATTGDDDHRVFRWMFDRLVVPRAIASDLKFYEEYNDMTRFIWPEEWLSRETLPRVDTALKPFLEELFESVITLRGEKERPGAVRIFPAREFPINLRILEESFSAIFQASRRSREKMNMSETVYESVWRHDHDRLLYDFFIRLLQPEDAQDQLIVDLEDPSSRPTLETTLRFPKSDNLQWNDIERSAIQRSIDDLLYFRHAELGSWLKSRGASESDDEEEYEHSTFVHSQYYRWRRESRSETEAQRICGLGQFPSTGKCDALGRLVVSLPISWQDVGAFPLVVRAAGKDSGDGGRPKVKSSMTKTRTHTNTKTSAKMSSDSLAVPDGSGAAKGSRYAMLSTAVSTSMPSDSVAALTAEVKRLGLATSFLELPILAIEYKKASDDQVKGTNQLRMYLSASVKFLQAVGVTDFAVYGVQTDGPIAVLPAAILRNDNFVHLFERLVERVDISTPLGAWQYATILCRLAEKHSKVLEAKFNAVKENFVESLHQQPNQKDWWTLDHQKERLKADRRAKSPVKEVEEEKSSKKKKKSTE